MSRCLKDSTLLLLHGGGASSAERDHLTRCQACAARYQKLERDLAAISEVLRQEPPPTTATHRVHLFTARRLSAAAVVGLALVLMWQGMRLWHPSRQPLNGAETASPLDEFPSNLLSLNEALAMEVLTEFADDELASAALEADRPCEWYDLPGSSEIESSIDEAEMSAARPLPSCVEVGSKDVTRRQNDR